MSATVEDQLWCWAETSGLRGFPDAPEWFFHFLARTRTNDWNWELTGAVAVTTFECPWLSRQTRKSIQLLGMRFCAPSIEFPLMSALNLCLGQNAASRMLGRAKIVTAHFSSWEIWIQFSPVCLQQYALDHTSGLVLTHECLGLSYETIFPSTQISLR